MPTVAEALRQHVPGYLKTFGARVPLGHRKVLSYIMRCQTGKLGNVIYRCKSCQAQHWVGRSCGNRHCPNCQKEKTYTSIAVNWLSAAKHRPYLAAKRRKHVAMGASPWSRAPTQHLAAKRRQQRRLD